MREDTLSPLQIGSLSLPFPVGLAPMAGFTDAAMRALCGGHGCGFTFTEVANAQGLVHGSQQTFHLLEMVQEEQPVAVHMYGFEPEGMAEAAQLALKFGKFSFVDVNAGCPVRKIVAKGAGVALMKDPARMAAIVRALVEAVPLPVTVKTRLGLSEDKINISEVAHAVEEAGASALFLHARLANNKHSGPADWEALARIKSERNIAVIGNGGVKEAHQVFDMIRETGVDGVIIGRAAIGNPWIFDEIKCMAERVEYHPPTDRERIQVIEQHFDGLVRLKARNKRYHRKRSLPVEHAAALHFRAHLVKYLGGRRRTGDIRRHLSEFKSKADVMNAVQHVLG